MSLRPRLETLHLMSPPAGWSGTTVLIPVSTGQRVAVYSMLYGSSANCEFRFVDTSGNAISGEIFGLASTSAVIPQNDNMDPWFMTAPDTGLQLAVTTGPVFGDIYYLFVSGP
jgi:hypothetical protein